MGRYVEGQGTTINELDELLDVNSPSPNDGELLIYNIISSQWENSDNVDGGTF